MLRTKFKYWAIIPLIISLALLILLFVFIILLANNFPIFGYIIISGIMLLIAFLIIVELKNKVVLISIENDSVKSIKFLGLGSQTIIRMNEINGYKTCSVPGEWATSEVLYLMVNNKKMIRFSELYHKNYHELRNYCIGRFKNLGQVGYNLFS